MKKPHGWIAVIVLVASVAIPIYLPRVIENNTQYCSEKFSTGDILSYGVALIVSIFTIIGLSWINAICYGFLM